MLPAESDIMFFKIEQNGNMVNLFSGLITSKARIKIIMRLFTNPAQKSYLRELAEEFKASPAHIKEELEQLKSASLLRCEKNGRQLLYSANVKHPIFSELHSMVHKALGMDKIIDSLICRLGNLRKAILVDDYAEGKDNGIIDILLIGDVNRENLLDLTLKTERYIERKIRTLVLTDEEYQQIISQRMNRPFLVLWECEDDSSNPTIS